MEYDIGLMIILVGAGFIAGFINTIAGGGSMLTLPALIIMGMPADIANGTNRVGVLLQSIAGSRSFHKKGKLEPSTIIPTIIPTLSGSLLGSVLVLFVPESALTPVLLGAMLIMAFIMLVRPSVVAPPPGTPVRTLRERPSAWAGLFLAGLYGGFVQAGVGFILIAALAGGLRYDLVRANALKMAATAMLTVVALAIFALNGKVLWGPGLILAIGMVAGAMASVNFAISVPQVVLKWVMFALIVITCIAAYLKDSV
jgi:uncharacterized protein